MVTGTWNMHGTPSSRLIYHAILAAIVKPAASNASPVLISKEESRISPG